MNNEMPGQTPIHTPQVPPRPAPTEIPLDPNAGIPPPPPEIIPAQGGGSKLSPLRIAVIILAVLALGGGLAFLVLPPSAKPTPTPTPPPTSAPLPTITERPAGLSLQASDDPAILEKEINDINLDELDLEEAEINQEMTNL